MPSINIFGPADGVPFDVVSGIISTVGRDVTLHYVSETSICQICLGKDPLCPTCFGHGKVEIVLTYTTVASIRWKPSEDVIYKPTGRYMDGDCKISIVYSPDLESMLKKCKYIDVDSRRCVIDSVYRKGSPINRIEVILMEDKDLDGSRIG